MARSVVFDKIGLVFAMPEELAGFERVMAETRSRSQKRGGMTQWYFGHVTVLAGVSGVGRERSAEMAQRLVDAGVTCLVCAGFAAALDPTAQVGDVFLADTIFRYPAAGAPAYYSSPLLMSTMPPKSSSSRRLRRCSLVTSDNVVISASEKSAIFRSTGAAMLDMESYGAAEVCERMEVPFAALRSVSDRADQTLPEEVKTLLSQSSNFGRTLVVAGKPRLWVPLTRLHNQAGIAAGTLADTLGMMLLRLI